MEADYLIIDCAEFRKKMFYFPETGGWFTESHKDLLDIYIERGLIPKKYEVVDPLEIDKRELYGYLNVFCEKLLSLFDREHIILFEIEAVEFHTDGKTVNAFSGRHELAEKYNLRMKRCFDYVKSYLHGCHIVEFPNGVIGDTNHKWGKALLHYVPEYYEYSLKAVDIITKNRGNRLDENRALESLKHNYEKIMIDKYSAILRNKLETSEKEASRAKRIFEYEQYFKSLLVEDGKEKIRIRLENDGISSCALYGWTQITDVFIPWFRTWKIQIEYVVENYNVSSTRNDISLIKRDDINLLKCRNMIVCDADVVAVKEKLARLGYEGTVLSYKDLVN